MRGLLFLCVALSAATGQSINDNLLNFLKLSRHTILLDLINTAGLNDLFTHPNSSITVFAPNERSIQRDLANIGMTLDQLKADVPLLKKVLSYHVIEGIHSSPDFINERLFNTMSGDVLRTNHYVYNNNYYIDGSMLQTRNIKATNGIFHQVAHILFPIEGNVYEVVGKDPELKTLAAAVGATNLDFFLQDQAPITLFAPTDAAFALLGNKVSELLKKPDLLKEILMYHVIPGSLYRGGMHDAALHTFEEDDRITLDRNFGSTTVDGSRFSKYDISAKNGVIHKIDQVLVPSSLMNQI